MPRKKKSQSNHANSKAKSLKDLELQNEVIYNKKHIYGKKGFHFGCVRFIVASCFKSAQLTQLLI